MSIQYLMNQDQPVLKIENYNCIILDYAHLPYSLRYQDVNYDDVMHGFTETRCMNIGKTNGKKILSALGISQTNPYAIAKIYHFSSLTDCYWMKEESDNITWEDVSLYRNAFEQLVSKISLFGEKHVILQPTRIYTPEPMTAGMSAKAWIRENDTLYLYKVGKLEIPASILLDALGAKHVPYQVCTDADIKNLVDTRHAQKIADAGEVVVKSRCITNEDISIITWEDYSIYCDRNGRNPFEEVKKHDGRAYYEMQVADYILGNDDRHEGNWGFFVDNKTGQLLGLHPLMDHDHSFENEVLYSQTTEHPVLMEETLQEALTQVDFNWDVETCVDRLPYLSKEQREGVKKRLGICKEIKQNNRERNQKL